MRSPNVVSDTHSSGNLEKIVDCSRWTATLVWLCNFWCSWMYPPALESSWFSCLYVFPANLTFSENSILMQTEQSDVPRLQVPLASGKDWLNVTDGQLRVSHKNPYSRRLKLSKFSMNSQLCTGWKKRWCLSHAKNSIVIRGRRSRQTNGTSVMIGNKPFRKWPVVYEDGENMP